MMRDILGEDCLQCQKHKVISGTVDLNPVTPNIPFLKFYIQLTLP